MIVPLHDSRDAFECRSNFLAFPTLCIGVEIVFGHLPRRLLRELVAPLVIPVHVDPPFKERDVFKYEVNIDLSLDTLG